jgi:hypothetical protein
MDREYAECRDRGWLMTPNQLDKNAPKISLWEVGGEAQHTATSGQPQILPRRDAVCLKTDVHHPVISLRAAASLEHHGSPRLSQA